MQYLRQFPSKAPFSSVDWEYRTAEIRHGEKVIFSQENIKVPTTWSQLALNIVASKYFYKGVEKDVDQLLYRVASTIAKWGLADGYFENLGESLIFQNDLQYLLVHQMASFNSPVWFNVGLYDRYGITSNPCNWHWDRETDTIQQPENPFEYPPVSACYIQPVEDTLESIMDLARSEALLFKFGSGSGANLSTLRSSHEAIDGGGKSSGPVSFMRIYDQVGEVVTSGGRTRRAAILRCLNITHPDIEQFITCKAEEEEHVHMLISQGVEPERSSRSAMYQNMNLSVRVCDEFMKAVKNDDDWVTTFITDPSKKGPTYKARDLWKKIAEAAWACGDPGVQFDTTTNNWNTIPNTGKIEASNPCGEFVSINNSACNLASLNLVKFLEDGVFNYEDFGKAVKVLILAQDILIDRASYPLPEIAKNAHRCRPIGLGYTNFGALCMLRQVPYDSNGARSLCQSITSYMTAQAYITSAELAKKMGAFPEWQNNSKEMLDVLVGHKIASDNIMDHSALWSKAIALGGKYGYRNSQVTLLAPTGTISFMMDCETTGIEPEIALVKTKQLSGGGVLQIVNSLVEKILRQEYSEEIVKEAIDYIQENGTLNGFNKINEYHQRVFATSLGKGAIPWSAHIEMMAAAQPFLSGAISKTINMPEDSTPEDVSEAYMLGWVRGLKSLAVYRDQSKGRQPLLIQNKKAQVAVSGGRKRLPDTRDSLTHRFEINEHTGYFTVGLYPDGTPGELFISMSKEGSTLGGLLDCFGIAVSIGLQYGVPLSEFIEKFSFTRFEPNGWTKHPDIKMARSIIDYIFRWIQVTFKSPTHVNTLDAPICEQCGAIMTLVGACYLCSICGTSGGCG
jgi:ribonucleoside-diphosphate reductase alpha chain